MKQHFFITLFLLTFFSFSLYSSEVIHISQNNNDISLLASSEIYVESRSEKFKSFKEDFLSFGYLTDQAIWVKFTLHNDSNTTLQRVLHVDNSMLDSVILYKDQNNSEMLGTLHRSQYNEILDPYFSITLQPRETHTYYLRITSNSCPSYFHIYLETKDVLWKKTLQRELILAAFFALVFALAIYNLFIFFFTKEKLYLLYTLFIFALANNHLSYTSFYLPILHEILSDENLKNFMSVDSYLGIYYLGLYAVVYALFGRELMGLYRYRFLDFIIKLLITLDIVSMLLSSRYFYLIDLNVYIGFTIISFLFLAAIYLVYKKDENAIYIFFGFGINLLGHLLFLLYNLGLYLPQNGYWYFYETSVSIEALLFAIILSKRLNHTKALAKALSTQKVLTRELHHRVKNNLQFIVSFYRLKLRKYLNNEGKERLQEAEQSVRSIGKIHEILYVQNNLAEVDTQLYFENLIEEIKRGYPRANVAIMVTSKIKLNIDEAIYCGIIINELITNALKYAFSNEKGEISVSLQEEKNGKFLTLQDNGKGFEYNKNKSSFGLNFIENLIENELKGNLEFRNNNGAYFQVRWH